MLKNKFMIMLFVGIFPLTACLISPSKTSIHTDLDDHPEWQIYTNAKYGFTLQFPSAWQVIELPTQAYPDITDQIWFVSESPPLPQTDSRADIVFIFTQQDPSTAWDPQYFDNYQSDTLQLGDMQARRISGTHKESRFSEMVVLIKIGDYFLQALPNLGEASLSNFDQVISSIHFTLPDPTISLPTGTNHHESLENKAGIFDRISFTIPESLAMGTTAKKIPAFVDPSGFMYNDVPRHIRFDLTDPYTALEPFSVFQPGQVPWSAYQNSGNPGIIAQIFIFPTTEYAQISPMAGERIETLKSLLADNTLPTKGALPVLPTFNSAQDFLGQVYPVSFQGGRGLRFIARYTQEATPVVNPVVFYTFQGLTSDESLYVAAFFPLYISVLPDRIQVEDWDVFNKSYQGYMADIMSRLGGLASNDFEPNLETLDSLIRSITIMGTPTSSTNTTPITCFVTGFSPIAFLPDGYRILGRTENGVQIFNLQTMVEDKFLEAPTGSILPAVALSPDGEVLAWALEDFSIQLIRISDKKLLHTLTGHTDIIGKLSFSPDGTRLVSASHDTWVRVWDLEGNLIDAFQPPGALAFPNEVLGIGISPDGTLLATIPFDGPVKLWDLRDYRLVHELGSTGGYDTSDISFSSDGQLVASDTATGLFLWDTSDGTELLSGNPGINSTAVTFSPDGRFLAYGDECHVVLSSPDGSQKIRTLIGHPAPIGILFFSPDGSLLLSSDWVETRIWRVEDGQLLYVGKSACP